MAQKVIQGGRLRNRVTIERILSESRDDRGGVEETWATLSTVWAGVEPVQGGSTEHFETDVQESEVSHVVKIRDTDITSKDRVKLADDSLLNIRAVIAPEKPGGYTLLYCKEPTTDD